MCLLYLEFTVFIFCKSNTANTLKLACMDLKKILQLKKNKVQNENVYVYLVYIFSVDCLYTPTNHLHHTFEACVIQPGQSIEVAFTFYPREAKKYNEIVTFEINGLSKQDVEIRGQGTEMKVRQQFSKATITVN